MQQRETLISGKLISVLLLLMCLGGCQSNKQSLIYDKMTAAIGTASAAEVINRLELPENTEFSEDVSDSAVTYTLLSSSELIPDGIEADSSTLYINLYEDKTVMVQLMAVCEEMSVSEAYEAMKSQCDEIYAVYPESAFTDIYADISAVNGEEPLSFTERFPSEEDFISAFDARSGDTYPVLETEERWWTNEEKTVDFYLTVRVTPDGAVFTWVAEEYEAVQEYLNQRIS